MVGGTTLASLVVSLWMEPKEQFLAAIVGVLVGLLVWLVVLQAFGAL
jgi:mannitol-specific phosphotransferase system IIBC component